MSIDIQLAHECPHLILEEQVALGTDRQSLVPRAPVAASNVVRLLVNDEFYVPPGGLFAQAQLEGSVSGPFRIAQCDTTFTIESSTETASFHLPYGNRVQATTIAKILQDGLTDVLVEVIQGHLILTDTATVGMGSFIRVSGLAASSLGFKVQVGARGRKVYPGWVIASSPNENGRYPKFVEPVKMHPVFKLLYVTERRWCPRCSGIGVENDYRFDLQGEAVTIQDENLLYQAALKILLTVIRSNPYHPSYGSAITTRIGAKAIGATASLITGDVQTALANMQAMQREQGKYQAVSAKERLYSVRSVRVSPFADDPTAFNVDVVVANASGEPVSLSIVFTTPGVVALEGTNGLSLGKTQVGL